MHYGECCLRRRSCGGLHLLQRQAGPGVARKAVFVREPDLEPLGFGMIAGDRADQPGKFL